MAKDIILMLVLVGFVLALCGLWCHSLPTFVVGLFVGGFLPSVVGICITK